MYRRRFERLVGRAIRQLPSEIREWMDNVAVVVEDNPTPTQIRGTGLAPGSGLLGLYEGIPLTERTSGYGMVLPDKITIFKEPIEAVCYSDSQIVYEIRRTIVHEFAHHFGISDAHLRRLGC